MPLINTSIQAVVFLIKNGPIGIPIRKQVQNTMKSAFTEIKSVVWSLAQSIDTMYVDMFPQRKKQPDIY